MTPVLSTANVLLCCACFAALLLALGVTQGRLLALLLPRLRAQSRATRVLLAVLVTASGFLLLRPHEDTFVGLDTSGYRHMATAIAAGRPLRSVDQVLAQAPLETRNAFLLLPDMRWRNTRDRSFQVMSLQSCLTEPFFYPLLPEAAVGLDTLVPGTVRDYLVPLCGWLFFTVCLVMGAAGGGVWGLCAAAALLVGSPLPAWFFRGYVPEAVGAIAIAGALLTWSQGARVGGRGLWTFFALGLALSLHPLLIVLVVPAVFLLLLSPDLQRREAVAALLLVALGALPLYLMTKFVCQPYGNIFRLHHLLANARINSEHRMVMSCAFALGIALAAYLVCPGRWKSAALLRVKQVSLHRRARLLLALLALTPLVAGLLWPATHNILLQGWREGAQGIRLWFGLLLGVLAVISVLRSRAERPFVLLLLVCVVGPVFIFLKGVEPTGLWSQRRLLPGFLLAIAVLTPATGWLGAQIAARPRARALRVALAVLLGLGGFANAARWPAPYLTRYEAGAQAWVDRLQERIDDRLTFFDYHPYSFPLTVDGHRRVYGLGEQAASRLPPIIAWLRERAATEEVFFATAYRNPGLEDGLQLTSLGAESAVVTRVRSKSSLPAHQYQRDVMVEFLRATPTDEAAGPLAVHKVMDGGPLALRGRWLPTVMSIRDGYDEVPAMWSREGAGVVGPLPRTGEHVRITVQGHAGQREDGATQRLHIVTPWGEATPWLALSNSLAAVRVEAPAPAQPGGARTGIYRLYAEKPYDPRTEGLRGYPADLGALIHAVDIEVVPDGSTDQPSAP